MKIQSYICDIKEYKPQNHSQTPTHEKITPYYDVFC